jgi:hypothetical protein
MDFKSARVKIGVDADCELVAMAASVRSGASRSSDWKRLCDGLTDADIAASWRSASTPTLIPPDSDKIVTRSDSRHKPKGMDRKLRDFGHSNRVTGRTF